MGDGFDQQSGAATADQDADAATRSADLIRFIFPAPSAIRLGEISL
jgi:hypothetical protein